MYAAWIGFAGAVIGGLFTLAGVLITIRYYNIQERRNDTRQDRNGSIVFLRLINLRVNTIRELLKYNEEGRYVAIKGSPIILDEEILLLFKQTQYLSPYLKDEQINELVDFICLLSEFESQRKDCLKASGNYEKEKAEDGIYFTMLGDFRAMLEENAGKCGIESILRELGEKIR